jgi:hypothetical protein
MSVLDDFRKIKLETESGIEDSLQRGQWGFLCLVFSAALFVLSRRAW